MCRRTTCFTAHATPPWLACADLAQMAHTGGVTRLRARSIAAAEPDQVATIVRREIGALRVGEREYDVRHRRSAEIVARAGYTLGIIERVVLPSDVALARKLLCELLDAEQQIAEQAYEDDYGAEELFAQVRSLLSATAER